MSKTKEMLTMTALTKKDGRGRSAGHLVLEFSIDYLLVVLTLTKADECISLRKCRIKLMTTFQNSSH
jgi:hypothetical protein